jgi:hypothetical protein
MMNDVRAAGGRRADEHHRGGPSVPTALPSTTTAARYRAVPLLLLTAVLGFAGTVAAPAAHAIDDPSRPDARVTHGPSCAPGGVVVEIAAGTAAYSVVLASTRLPGGEDSGALAAGALLTLRTGDVAWGETIDPWLEFTAADGTSYVDELPGFTFTRPAEDDCAAITAPATQASVPPLTLPGLGALPSIDAVPDGEEAIDAGAPGLPDAIDQPPMDGAGARPSDPAAAADADGGPARAPAEGPERSTAPMATVVVAQTVPLGATLPLVPMFAAALTLGAAAAGLVSVALRRRPATPGRRPPGSA